MKLLALLAALLLLTACPSKPSETNEPPQSDSLKTDTAQRRPPIMARQHRLRINPE